jgi:predicted  nucleic acid-binding Zn-ribbon protein
MKASPYLDFILFVKLDYEIESIKKRLLDCITKKSNIQNELQKKEDILKATRLQHVKARQILENAERERCFFNDCMRQKEEALEQANSREYSALAQGLLIMQSKERAREDALFEYFLTYENTAAKVTEVEGMYKAYQEEACSTLEVLDGTIDQLSSQVRTLEKKRTDMEPMILDEWLTLYYAMKKTVVNPMVSADEGHCSGCYSVISLPNMSEIRHHKLIRCSECYRFLYTERIS